MSAKTIVVMESGAKIKKRAVEHCYIRKHLNFSVTDLFKFCDQEWNLLVYDSVLLCAAIEFADRVVKRDRTWSREIELIVPVHEPDRWNALRDQLTEILVFLTGDGWSVYFVSRIEAVSPPPQTQIQFDEETAAVIPYSGGLDSRIVAELERARRPKDKRIVLIRLGAGARPEREVEKWFGCVPYHVKPSQSHLENSSRSRGFRFLMIGALAAYLKKAPEVIVPESGQGALGPALVSPGLVYPDYRNHPEFSVLMSKFVSALLETKIIFSHPYIWNTKGETLSKYISSGFGDWRDTRSCWQNQRNKMCANGRRLQCGICAACMLRRLAVFSAGQKEPENTYAIRDLSASTIQKAAIDGFEPRKWNGSLYRYGVAGALHMEHMARLTQRATHQVEISRHALRLGRALQMEPSVAESQLLLLFTNHATEWRRFVAELSEDSFVRDWVPT